MVLVVEDLCGIGVPGVTSHVVREHEDDVVVRDAQPLHRPVERQGVGNVPVVEPEGNQTPALYSPAIAHQFLCYCNNFSVYLYVTELIRG